MTPYSTIDLATRIGFHDGWRSGFIAGVAIGFVIAVGIFSLIVTRKDLP